MKEAAETLYRLRLLHNTGYLDDKQFQSLYSDCEELKKLLQSITKTLKEKAEKQKIWIRKSEPETKIPNSKFQTPNSKKGDYGTGIGWRSITPNSKFQIHKNFPMVF